MCALDHNRHHHRHQSWSSDVMDTAYRVPTCVFYFDIFKIIDDSKLFIFLVKYFDFTPSLWDPKWWVSQRVTTKTITPIVLRSHHVRILNYIFYKRKVWPNLNSFVYLCLRFILHIHIMYVYSREHKELVRRYFILHWSTVNSTMLNTSVK